MARRSDHTQKELKELIINASIKLITEIGPSAFGTRAIAKEIGYSFGTIYHVYGDLETLRFHVKGRIMDTWYDELSEGMKDVEDKARYLVDTYIDVSEQQRFLWAFVFALPNESKENTPDWYLEKVEHLFSVVIEAFIPVTHNRTEAELAAKAIWPGIHGICVLAMTHKLEMIGDDVSPKTLGHKMLDIYLNGVKNLNIKDGATEAKASNA